MDSPKQRDNEALECAIGLVGGALVAGLILGALALLGLPLA